MTTFLYYAVMLTGTYTLASLLIRVVDVIERPIRKGGRRT